jgi:hypothetical protein
MHAAFFIIFFNKCLTKIIHQKIRPDKDITIKPWAESSLSSLTSNITKPVKVPLMTTANTTPYRIRFFARNNIPSEYGNLFCSIRP